MGVDAVTARWAIPQAINFGYTGETASLLLQQFVVVQFQRAQ